MEILAGVHDGVPSLARPDSELAETGFAPDWASSLAEGQRVKPLRVRPHNAEAEEFVERRRFVMVALPDAHERGAVDPATATGHSVRVHRCTRRVD